MDLNQEDLSKELGLNEPTNQDQPKIEEQSTKFKIGDNEYDQNQINELVGFATKVQEAEKRYNTKFDRVWPAYGESQNRLKELEQQVEDLKKPREEVPADQEAQIAEAKRAAKALGILTKDDLSELGIVTKEQFRDQYRIERATERLLEKADKLEEEIDGKDGRPAFKKDEILQYMADTGINDMEKAYKLRYEAELDAYKESKLKEAKKPGIQTMEREVRGSRQPESPKVTRDNLNAMLEEELYK